MPKSFYLILVIAGIVLLCATCISNSGHQLEDKRGPLFAGSETCKNCHAAVYGDYRHTAHFLTSAPASALLLAKQLAPEQPPFTFSDNTLLAIEKRNGGFYQVAYVNGKERTARRFDVAFGSGEKAQTYGYWQGSQLLELPMTYYSRSHAWVNSPGFPATMIRFDRVIVSRCLECHASYAERSLVQTGPLTQSEALDQRSLVYGIDCERCHGPAAAHVNFHTEHPQEKKGKYIAAWGALTRQQKLDACAVCHSGNDQAMQRSTFGFRPGDTLSHYFYPDFGAPVAEIDVHGKQSQLLALSRCFIQSGTLECASCHNTHKVERNSPALFSSRCMDCHNTEGHSYCRMTATLGNAINTRCIDCHMPEQVSRTITFSTAGKVEQEPYYIRTHRIAVYPEATAKVKAGISKALE